MNIKTLADLEQLIREHDLGTLQRDEEGQIIIFTGIKNREDGALVKMEESSALEEAINDWLNTPINEQGTPFVPHPEDFSPSEQRDFVDFVRQSRFVSAEEQRAKIQEIIQRREERLTYRLLVDVNETESGPRMPRDTLVRIIDRNAAYAVVESTNRLPDPGDGSGEVRHYHGVARVNWSDIEEV